MLSVNNRCHLSQLPVVALKINKFLGTYSVVAFLQLELFWV
ncbi:conserved hypothetical protein [Yersinia pestis Angola]|nr:conserved hypothetical protein [Yersinia pestis Angola]